MRTLLKKLLRFVVSILVLAGIAAGGYFGFRAVSAAREAHAEKAPDHAERAPVPVRIATVERRTLVPSLDIIGTVLSDPERFATLTAATPGLVQKLVAREGERVEKGATLVQMDDRPARNLLAQADAAYTRLTAKPRVEELAQAQALVAKMKSNYDAMEARLRKSRDTRTRSPELVPEVQLLDDVRNAESAKAELSTAEAQLQLLEKGPREEQRKEARTLVEAAQLQLDYCKVIAPFSGEVVDMKARVGQRADVGTPLVTLLDSTEVIVQARIPSNRLPFAAGMFPVPKGRVIAQVHCLSFPDRLLPATSGWLSRQTEGITGDVPLRLRVPNAEGTLRVGMTVRVTLLGTPVECLAISEAAYTVNEEGKTVVVVDRDGKAVPTEVELSKAGEAEVKADGWVSVAKGLHAGDRVIIENGYALPEGTPVKSLPAHEGTK